MAIYKIDVNVTNAPSGSERLANEQGQPITPKDSVSRQRTSVLTKVEELIGKERYQRIKTGAATTIGVGALVLDQYEQNANFRGDTQTVSKISDIKKWGSRALVTGGLLATGNFLGAALYIGYTAYALAKENRELMFQRQVDSYKSNYYQRRLIKDVSGRSR